MLRSTETWRTSNTLGDVIKAVVDYIDQPNVYEAHSKGKNFLFHVIDLRNLVKFHLAIADEYVNNRAEFNRKANQRIDENPVARQWPTISTNIYACLFC